MLVELEKANEQKEILQDFMQEEEAAEYEAYLTR